MDDTTTSSSKPQGNQVSSTSLKVKDSTNNNNNNNNSVGKRPRQSPSSNRNSNNNEIIVSTRKRTKTSSCSTSSSVTSTRSNYSSDTSIPVSTLSSIKPPKAIMEKEPVMTRSRSSSEKSYNNNDCNTNNNTNIQISSLATTTSTTSTTMSMPVAAAEITTFTTIKPETFKSSLSTTSTIASKNTTNNNNTSFNGMLEPHLNTYHNTIGMTAESMKDFKNGNHDTKSVTQQEEQQEKPMSQEKQQRWRVHQMAEDYMQLVGNLMYPGTKLGPYGFDPNRREYPLEDISALGYLQSPLRRPSIIEMWSPYEISLFEASLLHYGKDFYAVSKVISTKSTKEVIDFYYIWKKTSHYKKWKSQYVSNAELVDLEPPMKGSKP